MPFTLTFGNVAFYIHNLNVIVNALYFILIFVHFFILLKVLVNIIVVFPIKVLLVLQDECSNMYGEV